jgi:hypothetical protein
MKKFAKFYDYLDVSAPQGLRIPEDTKNKIKFIDSFKASRRGLIVTVRATHAARLTRNNGFYLPDKMRKGVKTMLSRERGGSEPTDKPVLVNHEVLRDAVGRIVAADYIDLTQQVVAHDMQNRSLLTTLSAESIQWRAVDLVVESLVKTGALFEDDWQGLGYIKSSGLITDPDAIEKILDGRYLTVSTSAGSDQAVCSVCREDWVSLGEPCEHRPGKRYDDKYCFLIAGKLFYDEWSWVNRPGDTEAYATDMQLIDIPTNTGYQPVAVDQADLRREDSYVYDLYVNFNDSEENPVATTKEELLKRLTDTFEHMDEERLESFQAMEDAELKLAVDSMLKANETLDQLLADNVSADDIQLKDAKGLDGASSHLERSMLISIHNNLHDRYDWTLRHDKDRAGEIPKAVFAMHEKLMILAEENEFRDELVNGKLDMIGSDGEMRESHDSADDTSGTEMQDSQEECAPIKIEDIDFDAQSFTDAETDVLNDALEAEIDAMISEGVTCLEDGQAVDLQDAKLSTAARKKLKKGTFCGPDRSFPVPDCAHVTAARRLIGRYKGPGSKSAILACVNRKAKAMGCDSKDADTTTETLTTDNLVSAAAALVFQLTNNDQKAVYDMMVPKLVEAELLDGNLKEQNEALEAKVTEHEKEIAELKDQLKWLRVELRDSTSEYSVMVDQLEGAEAENHRLLSQMTAMTALHKSDAEVKYEDLLSAQTDKSLADLRAQFKDLQDNLDFGKMVARTEEAQEGEPATVPDPTVNDSETTDRETSDTMDTDVWADQVISRYKEIADQNGTGAAKRYLAYAKLHKIVPADFDISSHLESTE